MASYVRYLSHQSYFQYLFFSVLCHCSCDFLISWIFFCRFTKVWKVTIFLVVSIYFCFLDLNLSYQIFVLSYLFCFTGFSYLTVMFSFFINKRWFPVFCSLDFFFMNPFKQFGWFFIFFRKIFVFYFSKFWSQLMVFIVFWFNLFHFF